MIVLVLLLNVNRLNSQTFNYYNELRVFIHRNRQIKNGGHFRGHFLYFIIIYCYASKIFCRLTASGMVYRLGTWIAFYVFYSCPDLCNHYIGMEFQKSNCGIYSGIASLWHFHPGPVIEKTRIFSFATKGVKVNYDFVEKE